MAIKTMLEGRCNLTTPRSVSLILSGVLKPAFMSADDDQRVIEACKSDIKKRSELESTLTAEVINQPTINQFNI